MKKLPEIIIKQNIGYIKNVLTWFLYIQIGIPSENYDYFKSFNYLTESGF